MKIVINKNNKITPVRFGIYMRHFHIQIILYDE